MATTYAGTGTVLASAGAAARARAHAGVLAGLALAMAGAVILMGIITAEALYPAAYSTHDNEISDLGATRPPDSIVRQPSARIFNATMLASGALIAAGAYGLHRGAGARRVTIAMLVIGVSVFGVGVFPGNRAPMHGIFALLAFTSGGVGAILSAKVQQGPSKYLSIVLGAITLAVLAFAMVGSNTAVFDEMGDGGTERWVAYPVVLWLIVFGGYLMGVRRDTAFT
jgi:hypothetical membrane protein